MKTEIEIIEFLKQEIQNETLNKFNAEDLDISQNIMADLGVDSLGYATIMLAGESFVDGKINENIVWSSIRTIGDLARELYKCQF